MPQLNSTLKRFFAYYRPHRRLFLLDFSCAILSGLLELGFPIAVKTFVDKLLPSQNWGLILGATAGLLAIYLINTALQYIVKCCGGCERGFEREISSKTPKIGGYVLGARHAA